MIKTKDSIGALVGPVMQLSLIAATLAGLAGAAFGQAGVAVEEETIGMPAPSTSMGMGSASSSRPDTGIGDNPGPMDSMGQSGDGAVFGLPDMDPSARRVIQIYNASSAAGSFGTGGTGRQVIVLDDRETAALIGNGWGDTDGDGGSDPALRDRVNLFVAIAVQQGYGAHVGALQASYGTPQENGLIDLQRRIRDLEGRASLTGDERAELAALRADLAARREAVKPGSGPSDGWEMVNLDVNGDGRVDQGDLN